MRKSVLVLLLVLLFNFASAELLSFDRDLHIDKVLKQFHPALFYLMENNETIYESEKVVE